MAGSMGITDYNTAYGSGGHSHGYQQHPVEGNVLLCTIENMMYPVTVDALTTVFAQYGAVQKVTIFEKANPANKDQSTCQALVQYGDNVSAGNAKSALEGHAIYEGGYNRLRVFYSKHQDLNVKVNNEKSWDFTNSHIPTDYGSGGASGTNDQDELKVSGVDYEQAHEEIARAAAAAMSGQPLPPSMIPLSPMPQPMQQPMQQGPHPGMPPQGYAPHHPPPQPAAGHAMMPNPYNPYQPAPVNYHHYAQPPTYSHPHPPLPTNGNKDAVQPVANVPVNHSTEIPPGVGGKQDAVGVSAMGQKTETG